MSNVLVCVYISIGRPLLWVCYWRCLIYGLCDCLTCWSVWIRYYYCWRCLMCVVLCVYFFLGRPLLWICDVGLCVYFFKGVYYYVYPSARVVVWCVLVCVCISIGRLLLWVCYWSCLICGLCVYFYRASTVMNLLLLLLELSNLLCVFFF